MATAFEKRIKRHVLGKAHDFFAAAAPGLEGLCLEEFRGLGLNAAACEGGAEFSGKLHDCFSANLSLSTASRVLMRLFSFRAANFAGLEKAAAAFPWELFLPAGAPLAVNVTARHCRLYHTDAVAERIESAVRTRLGGLPEPSDATATLAPQRLFARGVDDRFTLSLDSSGDNLYRRGIKTHGGKAPLRETLAAAALIWAGYSAEAVLLDPMCGAGTFSIEAALRAKSMPPGWCRRFAFMDWPAFRPQRWQYLRSRAGQGIKRLEAPRILASDLDPLACRRLEECLERSGLSDAVAARCGDFFELDPADFAERPGIVALNPPYGRRLGSSVRPGGGLSAVIERLCWSYRGWTLVLVVPQGRGGVKLPFPVQAHPVLHGGLNVNILTGVIPLQRPPKNSTAARGELHRHGGSGMDLKALRINGKRLRSSLEEMAKIGATAGGGVQRLTLTDEDKQARDLFVTWLKEIDCRVTVDEMGNIFGRRPGKNDALTPVMSGSHIDSQPKGGRFDGILGVMGALEVLRTLHENRVETERPLVIVDWTNEEGSRFAPAMVASGVWAGALERDWAYDRRDINNKRFEDELIRIGYKGSTPCRKFPVHCYYEFHIEQGPMLEREKKTIGAPKGILCLHWYDIHLSGEANQVGPTPMEGRRDALVAAAEMILKVRELPDRMGGNMVATVGEIQNYPNSRNIIPDRVHFTVDIRSWDDAHALKAWERVRKDFEAIAARHGCPIRIEETWRVNHSPFDEKLVQRVLDVATELGYPNMQWVSGAGHDASYTNQVCPTAMIFVPSIGGRSHVEVEKTRWEDCEAGANVLLHCLLKAAAEK